MRMSKTSDLCRHAAGWMCPAVGLTVLLVLHFGAGQATQPSYQYAESVWTTSSLTRIGQTDAPGTSTSISLYAARNETYSFQIGIRSPVKGLTNVNVTASDLTGASGAVIASSNIALFRESYINVPMAPPYPWSWTIDRTNPPGGPGMYPDGLIPFVDPETGKPAKGGTIRAVPFSLNAGMNQPIWVDISVPSSAAAGTYTGALVIQSDQGKATVPVKLRVWNFSLPVVPSFKSSIQATRAANQTLYMSHELLRNRVSPDWEEGSHEQTLVTHWGLNSTNLWFSTALNINNCANASMPPSPSVAQFRAAVAQHQNNILLYNFTADEIGDCTQLFPRLIQWAANMHLAGGVKNLVTVQPVPALENDGTGTGRSAVDIWTVLPLQWDKAQTATREMTKVLNKGDTVWSYNVLVQDGYSPKMEINFALLDYRIAVGFISQSLGITGFQQWSVDQWTSDPWNVMTVLNGTPSDGLLVYPGRYVGLVGVAPSIRLKCLREGVNDFEYVEILKGLGQGTWALQQAATVGQDWHTWTRSTADIEAVRITLGNKIDRLSTQPTNAGF
jgi:hypothetical protein